MAILLMAIDKYFIGRCWCLLLVIILMTIVLMVNSGYYISDY